MIARIELTYQGRQRLEDLLKSDVTSQSYKKLCEVFGSNVPEEKNAHESWRWPTESVIDLETDGRVLLGMGIQFEVKNFKGTVPIKNFLPDGPAGKETTIHVHIANLGLLAIDEVDVLPDCCTDLLRHHLQDGWRILCVCPQPNQRRPDYVLGRTKEK